MNEPGEDRDLQQLQRKVTEVAIRLFLVAGLALWCFLILEPFILPLVWGMVIAVAFQPIVTRLEHLLGGRRKLACTLFILVGIGALVTPVILVSESFFDGVKWLQAENSKDAIRVSPPPEKVSDWPLIGKRVHEVWQQASENLEVVLERNSSEVKVFASWLLSTLTGFGTAFLLTIIAVIIAGVMLMHASKGTQTAQAIGTRLGGANGEAAINLAAQTMRSVAYGVIGVAVIQAALAAIGLYLADVPVAGLWTGLVLILAVTQLPPLLILAPAAIYVFATSDSTATQVLFAIWAVFVSFSDVFLKPMLLGRGVMVPMPVILIGAIGGLMRGGIIGLFVGAVVLAVGYQMFKAWMQQGAES